MLQSKSKICAGVSIVGGKGYGKAVVIDAETDAIIMVKIDQKFADSEIKRFEAARDKAIEYYNNYSGKYTVNLDKKDSDISIVEMYKYIINDKTITKQIIHNIANEHYSAESAVQIVAKNIIETFQITDSEYFRERGKDIEDVRNKVLFYLKNENEESHVFNEDVVLIIKRSFLLSDIIGNNIERIKAIICASSGKTSHAVIVAHSRSIPVIVRMNLVDLDIDNGVEVLVDSDAGTFTINPSENLLDIYYTYVNRLELQKNELPSYLKKPVFTRDGMQVTVMANVSLESDVQLAVNNGADGIGLVRTEILFNENFEFPTENDQIKYYNAIFDNMEKNKNVCIRVMDIGGDKFFRFMDTYEEKNPFMGCRAVRIYREKKEFVEVQLKAILKAGSDKKYGIMFPMITTSSEWDELRELTKNIASDLGIECPDLGVLFEVPLAILEISTFLDTINFASIGTNDLIQYLSAADRSNAKVNYLYNPIEPAFLKIIKNAIDECNSKGKPISICGDMAARPECTILLLGLGLSSFSVASPMIPIIKEIAGSVSIAEIKEETNHMLSNFKNTEAVAEWIDYMNDRYCKSVFSKYNFVSKTREL